MKTTIQLFILLVLYISQLNAQTISKEENVFFNALIEAKTNPKEFHLKINNYALAKCLNDETIADDNTKIIAELKKLIENDQIRNEFYGLVNYYYSSDKQLIIDVFQVSKSVKDSTIYIIDEHSMNNTIIRMINTITYEIKYPNFNDKIDSTKFKTEGAIGEETMAQFPGGESGLMNYIRMQVSYPTFEFSEDISGKVLIRFSIEPNGSVANVTLLKNISHGIDHEGMRVIKMMPLWKPATKNNIPVREWYLLPINFTI